jgi:hypothetical protein
MIAVARTVARWTLRWCDDVTHSWKPIVLVACALPLIGCSGSVADPAAFDRNAWLAGETADFSSEAPRLRMADGLVSSRGLIGKDRSEIAALLGPDSDTDKFRSYDRSRELVYWLGAERSFISIDSEWLVVRFDRNGRVAEARIVRD